MTLKLTSFRGVPQSVIVLGMVSLLTDMSSEMIYPLLPIFLTGTLGAGAISLGLIEGAAEAVASILKIFSGAWTDKLERRKPFVFAGYGLSGLMRPLIGFAGSWPFVLALRLADRTGKGIRSSPCDALIADVTPLHLRGRAFGVHKTMDHAGAVAGPLLAVFLMSVLGFSLPWVFFAAAIPGVAVMLLIAFGVKEAPRQNTEKKGRRKISFSLAGFGRDFKCFLLCMFVFALGSSTDAFILLRLSESGLAISWVAGLWAAHNLVKMGTSYFGGAMSDILGRRKVVIASWLLYAFVYFAFAYFQSTAVLLGIFLLYGLYFGLSEPVERAWVADLAPEELRGTAMGLYHGAIGIGALPASLLFGAMWSACGQSAAFALGGSIALLACVMLVFLVNATTLVQEK